MMLVLQPFLPVLSERMGDWARVLLIGAVLAPRQRTVTAIVPVMGWSGERQFQTYHRGLNRARWSAVRARPIRLELVVTALVGVEAAVIGAAADRLERRPGKRMAAKGHFRDPVLSSEKQRVASAGWRWLSRRLRLGVAWSNRSWALPFWTGLAAPEKTNQRLGKRHKTVMAWVLQRITPVRRWLPQRRLVLLTDGGLLAVQLGVRGTGFTPPVRLVSRWQLNRRRLDPPPSGRRQNPAPVGAPQPNRQTRRTDPQTTWVRQTVTGYRGQRRVLEEVTGTTLGRTPGEPHPLPIGWGVLRDPQHKFKATALCGTDLTLDAEPIIAG
jgi:hypothetical protein